MNSNPEFYADLGFLFLGNNMKEDNKNNGKKIRIPIIIEIAILIGVSSVAVVLELFFKAHQKFEILTERISVNPYHLDVAGIFVISLILYLFVIYFRKSKQMEMMLKSTAELEVKIEKSRDNLEERVQRRTVELARTNVDLLDEIAQHKKTEEALRLSEGRYRLLIESLPQSIFIKTRDLIYVSCNDNFARDVGLKPEEIQGKTDYELFPKELADKYRLDDKRIMDNVHPEEIDEHFTHEGKDTIVHTIKTPIKDSSGKVVGIIGIYWDVTEIKIKEAQISDLQKRIKFILGATRTGMDTTGEDCAMEKTKIMIVDDEEDICTLLCVTLSSHNYECLIANSGAKALELLVKEHPAVVLLDVRLGAENGLDVLKKIKSIDSKVKIIMLTVMDDEKTIHEAKAGGADDYAPKLSGTGSMGEEILSKLSLLAIKRKKK